MKEQPSDESLASEIPPDRLSEVHCVAVCFRQDGHILIAKRPSSKRRFPDRFEFGCGQLKVRETFQECLLRSYKESFDAILDFGQELVPIRTYIIEDDEENRKIPGIIFVARITNQDTVKEKKHTEIKWIAPNEVDSFSSDQLVPDFKKTAKQAIDVWNASEKNKKTNRK
jgi:hypothetical protein